MEQLLKPRSTDHRQWKEQRGKRNERNTWGEKNDILTYKICVSEDISDQSLNFWRKESLKSWVDYKLHRIFVTLILYLSPLKTSIYLENAFLPISWYRSVVISIDWLKTPESNLQMSSCFLIKHTSPLNAHCQDFSSGFWAFLHCFWGAHSADAYR